MNFKSLHRVLGTVLAVAVLVFSTVISASPAMADQTVTMGAGGLKFAPANFSVSPGEKVTFKVGMVPPHNVVFEGGLKGLTVPMQYKTGGQVSVTIPASTPAGQYKYFCTPHRGAGMKGVMTVK